ncbi:LOW QUALITY PROTEIN: protein gamma response 1-like [Juglans microcarpa x Juglans regia]|uniref:LOW QUALITY PROTEIN: protein gamma response 1-like n=1 Tax=Juglans microcarpa x Juglans regia TaxID=2249226 RepID=UPI001B7E99D1|nr:LOW QUALITY PROTEIN: protein gamma response 1-like [Juglans microcarpa x Juglans regia]
MERHLQKSSNLGNPTDCDDAKYVSGLSTILVATIQEAKDRISQIEYIFCSQLFPNFQSKSKSLQKIYFNAKKAAEDAFKERENNLKLQIESLQLEKLAALEENQALKLEMEKPSKDHEGKTNQLLAEVRSQQLKIDELEQKLKKSSVEIDEGMELQNRLLQLVQSKASAIVNVGKQLKEYEEKTNELLSEVARLQEKVDELQEELRRKTEKVADGKELQENLFKKIASLGSEILANEQKLTDSGKEKSLMSKLECLEDNASKLQEELEKKTREVEEGRKLQNQLLQQVDLNNTEMSKNKQQLQECENEKKLLLAKATVLEGKINELQVNLRGKSSEVAEGRDSYKKLLQQIDKKTSELLAEKKRGMEMIVSYKKLKSQYNFLCSRFGLTTENMLPQSDSLRHNQSSIASRDPANKVLDTFVAPCDTNKVMYDNCFSGSSEDEKGAKLVETMSPDSLASSFPVAPEYPSNVRSAPVAGSKRPASHWRDTRSGQCQGGPEPYDDFLSTPLENVRGNLNKAMKEQVRDPPVPIQKDRNFDYSDDETQDMNVECCPQKQQIAVPMAGRKGFKYVETVRKKADRENLKGIECKQCKKFYDAVLPDEGGSDTSGNQGNFRCEHHEGVSRHRYRYVPPMTPEGFWNIGFESEMS